ncbi:MAG: serine/threonine protein kinase, partial [Myxococcales bacterium]|nr:serine/threonine protein kinase [Myxococcales bacterium]
MRDKTKGEMSRVDTLPDGFEKLIGRTELVVGELIGGRFKLVKSLGSGGMGEVFVAENIAIGMRVAVKLLKPELLANPEFRQRFQNEAQAVASIEHPNVARFFDLVVGDPTFIVMEYVRGETLAERIRLGALPIERALAIAQRLCWGVDAAHAAGVVHRDLKPANVLLAPDAEHGETPKVIDFGLAKLAAVAGDSQLTRTGQIIGTPAYMSPEQIKGDKIDGRADVYALGCVLFEMLTGRTPFANSADDVQILYRQMHE